MQIAISNKIYRIDIITNIVAYLFILAVIFALYVLINDRIMCPALIFAANRNDSVIGRIEILVVSIRMRNGFSHAGALFGKNCAIKYLGLYIILDIIIANHIGSPKTSVKIRCLDRGIIYGFKPIKLINIIIKKNEDIIFTRPLICVDNVHISC